MANLKAAFFDIGKTLVRLNDKGTFEPFADSAAILASFSGLGVRLGVITNVDPGWGAAKVLALLAEGGLDTFFSKPAIITSFDAKIAKPETEIYRIAAKAFGLPIDACVFIADSDAEAKGAASAGMQVVHVPARANLPTVSAIPKV